MLDFNSTMLLEKMQEGTLSTYDFISKVGSAFYAAPLILVLVILLILIITLFVKAMSKNGMKKENVGFWLWVIIAVIIVFGIILLTVFPIIPTWLAEFLKST